MSEHPLSSPIPGAAEENGGTIELMSSFGTGELDSEHGVVLKDWSAQDFARIYVRFRPHLIGHARKFLREDAQAEEVVQDAFLYLMTALPELDSELGVLRFLKWKTKMLCLDLIRAAQTGLNKGLLPLPEDLREESEPLHQVERADDASIVQLALAKLNPRHREALIATIYEEKSQEEVAQQMGLSQNAFRQLLFRARSSFRKNLVGEAAIEGKSASEILSIASKKHAVPARILGASLAGLLAISFMWNLQSPLLSFEVALKQPSAELDQVTDVGVVPNSPENRVGQIDILGEEAPREGNSDPTSRELSETLTTQSPPDEAPHREAATIISSERLSDDDLVAERDRFRDHLNLGFASEMATVMNDSIALKFGAQRMELTAGSSLRTFLAMDLDTESKIQHLSIIFDSNVGLVTAVPTNSVSHVEVLQNGSLKIEYVATDFVFGDLSGSFDNATVEDAPVKRSAVYVRLEVDGNGVVTDASLAMLPRA